MQKAATGVQLILPRVPTDDNSERRWRGAVGTPLNYSDNMPSTIARETPCHLGRCMCMSLGPVFPLLEAICSGESFTVSPLGRTMWAVVNVQMHVLLVADKAVGQLQATI